MVNVTAVAVSATPTDKVSAVSSADNNDSEAESNIDPNEMSNTFSSKASKSLSLT